MTIIRAIRIDNSVIYRMQTGGLCMTPVHRFRCPEAPPMITTGNKLLDIKLLFKCFDGKISLPDLLNPVKVRQVFRPDEQQTVVFRLIE
jgi:hypothetical protein